MAWRSSGTTNDEMVNNLKRFGVISSEDVVDAFRSVDRRFFVPQDRQNVAHSDLPLKEGNVHISAPHIYGSVTEALELHPNSSMSFLNLGSGTGYLSCIVAEVLGSTSSNYAVEIQADVIEHCRESIERWKEHRDPSGRGPVPPIEIIRGNALQIDAASGETLVGFDRIYVGAALEKSDMSRLANLLRPGGIMVGPVDDELFKVMRIGGSTSDSRGANETAGSGEGRSGRMSFLRDTEGHEDQHEHSQHQLPLSQDFAQQVLSSVRFAPLLQNPAIPTVIPSRVWNPSLHHHYPESFRKTCKEILLCSRASHEQQPPPEKARVNVACTLPRAIWMEIISYTHRDWFEKPRSEVEFLRKRLIEEQAAAQRARMARVDAETRLHMAERERDIYRLLAMRWQARLQSIAGERSGAGAGGNGNRQEARDIDEDFLVGMDDITEAASAVFANEPVVLRLGGLGTMIRRFQREMDSEDDDEEDDDEEEDDEDEEQNQRHADMEDDAEMEDDGAVDMDETAEVGDAESMAISSDVTGSAMSVHAAVRSVAISSHDL